MSHLWDQCLGALRRQVPSEPWEQYLQPLRGWMDSGTLYIWVDAHLDDRRRAEILGHVWSTHDATIRRVVRDVNGGTPIRVRYELRPPERERIISERRMRDHREAESRRLPARCAEFRKLQLEEYHKLIAEGIPRLPGTREQQKHRLFQIVDARALRRLEEREQAARPIRASRSEARGEPPEDPPPWPPGESIDVPQCSPRPQPPDSTGGSDTDVSMPIHPQLQRTRRRGGAAAGRDEVIPST